MKTIRIICIVLLCIASPARGAETLSLSISNFNPYTHQVSEKTRLKLDAFSSKLAKHTLRSQSRDNSMLRLDEVLRKLKVLKEKNEKRENETVLHVIHYLQYEVIKMRWALRKLPEPAQIAREPITESKKANTENTTTVWSELHWKESKKKSLKPLEAPKLPHENTTDAIGAGFTNSIQTGSINSIHTGASTPNATLSNSGTSNPKNGLKNECTLNWTGYFAGGEITSTILSFYGSDGLSCRRECSARWALSWGMIDMGGVAYCYCGSAAPVLKTETGNRIWGSCSLATLASDTQNRFTFTGGTDAVVLDRVTELRWQSHKNQSSLHAKMSWSDAETYCASLQLGGMKGWRLPHSAELAGLHDTCSTPDCNDALTLNTSYFSTQFAYFWSSALDPYDTEYAMATFWANGFTPSRGLKKSAEYNVRCVLSSTPNAPENTTGSKPEATATLDTVHATTSSWHPHLSGTANVTSVYADIVNSNGMTVAGIGAVPVSEGRWSGSVPTSLGALPDGSYTVKVFNTADHTLLTTWTLTKTSETK